MAEEIDLITRFEEFLKAYKTEEGETPYHDAIGRLGLEINLCPHRLQPSSHLRP